MQFNVNWGSEWVVDGVSVSLQIHWKLYQRLWNCVILSIRFLCIFHRIVQNYITSAGFLETEKSSRVCIVLMCIGYKSLWQFCFSVHSFWHAMTWEERPAAHLSLSFSRLFTRSLSPVLDYIFLTAGLSAWFCCNPCSEVEGSLPVVSFLF